VYTIDAGQAAGTVVVGKTLYRNIKNSVGDVVGCHNDTSLTFTTGTVLTTRRPFRQLDVEVVERNSGTAEEKAVAATSGFGQGEYCIDHRTGVIYGVKATAAVSDTVAYKIETATSGGAGPSADVNLVKVAGVATAAGAGVVTAGTLRTTLASDDPAVALLTTIDADTDAIKTATELIDDAVHADEAAFTTGTDKGIVVEGLYEAAGSNVVDGQVGAFAMTIDRHLHVQTDGYDSGTDSQKVYEVSPLNQQYTPSSLADTTNVAATTHYYPSATGASMAGYKDLSFSGKLIDADNTLTLTVEAMNDEDTTSGDWIQVYGYDDKNNATLNSWSITNGTLTFAISFNEMNYRYYRVKLVAGGATNTVIIKERKKAL
jgi:hypothetical protein